MNTNGYVCSLLIVTPVIQCVAYSELREILLTCHNGSDSHSVYVDQYRV
jgi:hypothetical protein